MFTTDCTGLASMQYIHVEGVISGAISSHPIDRTSLADPGQKIETRLRTNT